MDNDVLAALVEANHAQSMVNLELARTLLLLVKHVQLDQYSEVIEASQRFVKAASEQSDASDRLAEVFNAYKNTPDVDLSL